jgi:hypothetical protein
MTQLQQRELARHDMWCRLIDGYSLMNKNQRKKAKVSYADAFGVLLPHQVGDTIAKNFHIGQPIEFQSLCVPSISFADCEKQTVSYTPIVQQEKEYNMAYSTNNLSIKAEEIDTSRAYALDSLSDVMNDRIHTLNEKFFIIRPHPKTWEEAYKWYEEGYFILDHDLGPESTKSSYSYGFFDLIQWGDKKADREGYEKAKKVLQAAYIAARDIISVKSDENERLKALQDFRNYTIH